MFPLFNVRGLDFPESRLPVREIILRWNKRVMVRVLYLPDYRYRFYRDRKVPWPYVVLRRLAIFKSLVPFSSRARDTRRRPVRDVTLPILIRCRYPRIEPDGF
ncbi:hypothetical protein BABINDRAFT_112050 [Babjeviella inositovora NRRL Y-12698]|uniref:Uncharacterized protein n=1 Tax=Babjeviella inositovora NRRL Y-12698 TaxID=984486 RepID=A0A1E3QVY0_9ASCO|nr:uncharacterized protein BABINDRAFT_112050 [Babjeviella inositovora NRRL Y-12698]ODQ81813.1 hypothetical protein BABINDRAFT_112050 [Babjeviella inositovora NRRL Y-12698]